MVSLQEQRSEAHCFSSGPVNSFATFDVLPKSKLVKIKQVRSWYLDMLCVKTPMINGSFEQQTKSKFRMSLAAKLRTFAKCDKLSIVIENIREPWWTILSSTWSHGDILAILAILALEVISFSLIQEAGWEHIVKWIFTSVSVFEPICHQPKARLLMETIA